MHGIYYNKLTMLQGLKDPTTYSIVEKDKSGCYTRWALLYQDILQYAILQKDKLFKDRELANWLLTKNQYYINYYNDPSTKKITDGNRVGNILDGIKDKLDDLVTLGVLESSTAPAEKGSSVVRVCKCTLDGRLLACIIESIDSNKREKAYHEAYSVIQIMLDIEPRASFLELLSALYKKYKDRGLFGVFVMDRLRHSLESDSEIRNIRQLQYASLVIFHTNDLEKGKLHFALWKETFSEMSPNSQELLLYGIKVDIEERMMFQCVSPKTYEENRYRFRDDARIVVLEGHCKNCNLGYPLAAPLIEYIQRTNLRPNGHIANECPQCKNNSLLVPIL